MKTTAQLFDECLASVSNDVKMELDMSFAIADNNLSTVSTISTVLLCYCRLILPVV